MSMATSTTLIASPRDEPVGELAPRIIDGITIRRLHFDTSGGLDRPDQPGAFLTLIPLEGIARIGDYRARCYSCHCLWSDPRPIKCWQCGEGRYLPPPTKFESYAAQ